MELIAIAALVEARVLIVCVAQVALAKMGAHVCSSRALTQNQHCSWDWLARRLSALRHTYAPHPY